MFLPANQPIWQLHLACPEVLLEKLSKHIKQSVTGHHVRFAASIVQGLDMTCEELQASAPSVLIMMFGV